MRAHRSRTAILAAATSVAALVLAPTAHATDADTQFLAVVAELGLQFDTPDDAVEAGNNVCDVVSEGSANNISPAEIRAKIVTSLLGEGVDTDQATRLMTAAVGAYCPVFTGIVTG